MSSYRCRHFAIHELVPSRVFTERGEKAWELLDDRLLIAIDFLRDEFGQMTINNYFWGGNRQWSGLRTADSHYYSPYSQHSFGRAVDVLFRDADVDKVRSSIVKNPDSYLYIRGMELGTSWLHIDTRNYNGLLTFKP